MKKRALALVLGGFGLLLMALGLSTLPEQISSKSWPSVRGMMLASEVVKHSSRKKSSSYTLKLKYEYRVADRIYQGTRQAAGRRKYELRLKADEALQSYAVGRPVEVFYHPRKPERALLEPGLQFNSVALLCFGLVFTAAALGLWIYWSGEIR